MPDTGDRWSTWDLSTAGERGPMPYPDWVVTELAVPPRWLGIVAPARGRNTGIVGEGEVGGAQQLDDEVPADGDVHGGDLVERAGAGVRGGPCHRQIGLQAEVGVEAVGQRRAD